VEPENASPSYLIVGATGGIGSELSRRLAESGARLVLAARGRERLEALAREVGGQAIVADATSFAAMDELVAAAGPLDGAVNLCGSILLKPAHLTSEDEFAETITRNLHTSFALVRAAIKPLRASRGSIVLMSSAAGSTGIANHDAIAAAKAGVEGLVRSAAATYATFGIRVNGVAPGLVDTPLAPAITSNKTSLEASIAMHPLRRIGTPADVAGLIQWLLGAEASWMTGQVLGIDGGLARVRARGG
jgi:NAD(P)-dependent dehydrogenase (short-subunit alcohol dehydrogenase family)